MKKRNEGVKRSMEEVGTRKRVDYNDYSSIEKAHIGQYAPVNGPVRAFNYFSRVLDKIVLEKRIITFRLNEPPN